MNPSEIRFHPAAVEEATAARRWYFERSRSAASAFDESLALAMQQVADHPNRWAKHLHGTRHIVLQKFPYVVVYRVLESVVEIVAVAHEKRRPGYWKSRNN
ncbi:MAG: type II toxin-antitoxin system RelE/ParE family toxin [Planctomycetota bacterium]|nr:type II toxin-antitoxin system RelE/ParE family toxin [Planctomycetota bacterium]MDA0918742.1 type II toxin-antitoxin system RelE/ParE family toxin [Planctomycetota bacterium]MDA1158685.1 type II toxin-antitoxin system RelE/ParE family toxin [Planctomycetota bacterium]